MMDMIALCADEESLKRPELLGLSGENLANQGWLTLFSDAWEARRTICESRSIKEVWVVSSETVEGINLAAAIKNDAKEKDVLLVSFEGTGSVMSRCEMADVGLLLGQRAFVERYRKAKRLAQPALSDPALALEEVFDGLSLEEPKGPYAKSSESSMKEVPVFDSASELSFVKRKEASPEFPHIEKGDKDAFVLAVVSGSGGTGKSTVAVSAAAMLQGRGLKTLLLDADLQFGDAEYLLGRDESFDMFDLMEDFDRVAKLTPTETLPAVLGAPMRLEQSEIVMNRLKEIIGFLKGYFDVIVVNTGAFWAEQHAQVIEAADKVFFLLDQRPSSIRACSHALDLCARCGIATKSFSFVLNGCSKRALLTSLDVSCALKGVKVEELKDGGKEVGELLGAGMPLELIGSKNAFVTSLSALLESAVPKLGDGTQGSDLDSLSAKRKKPLLRFGKRRAACL